ncbi:MAG: GGDEF domain-containing protein [Desulfobacterales bacterium]|nr:MAG: GGDEF domain-containing protein [Desulfobacterales bacterium]
MTGQLDDKIAVLNAQVSKLQSQKDRLLKELDDLEERFENQDRSYRKYFPVILDVVAAQGTNLSQSCADLADAMRKKASPVKINYIFEQMKTAILKEDIGPLMPKKKKGLFASFRKSADEAFMDDFKAGYQELVHSLKTTMDKKYKKKLGEFMVRIAAAKDTADVNDIRQGLFSLIFVYISENSAHWENVNAFIRDIVAKILEIETRLTASFEHTHSLVSANRQFESVLGLEMAGLKDSMDTADTLAALQAKITRGLSTIENALREKQKAEKTIHARVKKNQAVFKAGFERLKKQLDETTRYSESLEKKLNQDQLTGAFNRRAYDRKIADEMARFLRYGNVFALLIIDADKFKRINDRYGHAIGDRCLQEIIKRAHPLLRKNDMLARYGGEEFVVVMPETDAQGGRQAAEKIRKTIEKIEFLYKNETVRVTVSIGVSCALPGDKKHEQVFERADMAVYKAKENGRNQVVVV